MRTGAFRLFANDNPANTVARLGIGYEKLPSLHARLETVIKFVPVELKD